MIDEHHRVELRAAVDALNNAIWRAAHDGISVEVEYTDVKATGGNTTSKEVVAHAERVTRDKIL